MTLVHIEYVVVRRADAVGVVREEQSVQVVDQLRGRAELDFVAVLIEDIQCQRADNRVAHRHLLLEQVRALARTGSARVPAAPLVDTELRLILHTIRYDRAPVAVDDLTHLRRLTDELIPLVVGEVYRVARAAAVVVYRHARHRPALM